VLLLGSYAIFDKSMVTPPDANFGTSSTTLPLRSLGGLL
jgi:hypothetical protein